MILAAKSSDYPCGSIGKALATDWEVVDSVPSQVIPETCQDLLRLVIVALLLNSASRRRARICCTGVTSAQ